MDSIHTILEHLDKLDERSVLATIIKVEGSAYRKEGTSMLFTESGYQVGVISAGCLETDLAIQANTLLAANRLSRTLVYDMSAEDDLGWGRGAGCNGKIHILLEVVTQELRNLLGMLRGFLEKGIPVMLLKIIRTTPSTLRTVFVTSDHQTFGHANHISELSLKIAWQEDKSCVKYVDSLEANVFIHHFKPKPRLFIFGAGPDVNPLASISAKAGFSVSIWDWRPAYLNKRNFPESHILNNHSITETIKSCNFKESDSVVIMTHDFQKDREILCALLPYRQPGYIGILGPRKRTLRLLDGAAIPDYLHSPVGLKIGADGPVEVSISILAELIQTQRIRSKEQKGLSFNENRRYNRYLSSGGE